MQLGDRDAEIILLHSRLRAHRRWVERLQEEIGALRQRQDWSATELGGVLEGFASDLEELEKK